MGRPFILLACIVYVSMYFLSCDKEVVKLCDAEEYLGKFELLPGSELMVPYPDTAYLVFKNQENKEVRFIAKTSNITVGSSRVRPCQHDESLWIKKRYHFGSRRSKLLNDSLPYRLDVNLVAIATFDDTAADTVDHLKFEYYSSTEPGRYYTGFRLSFVNKEVTRVFSGNYLPVWEPPGKSFQEVYHGTIETREGIIEVYYIPGTGFAGFTDTGGNLWVFDRME